MNINSPEPRMGAVPLRPTFQTHLGLLCTANLWEIEAVQSFKWLWDTVEPHLPYVNHAKPLE